MTAPIGAIAGTSPEVDPRQAAPAFPPPRLLAERMGDEAGFRDWFNMVSQDQGLDPDPQAESNSGYNYRMMYAIGLEPEAVKTERQRLDAVRKQEPPILTPAGAKAQAWHEMRGVVADPRFARLSRTDKLYVLSKRDPAFQSLSSTDQEYVLQRLEASFGKDPIPWLLRPQGLFEENWIDRTGGPIARASVEGAKQAIRSQYAGFMQMWVANWLNSAAGVHDFMKSAMGWKVPTVMLSDMALEWMHQRGWKATPGGIADLLRTAAQDVSNHADAMEAEYGPLSQSTTGRIIQRLNYHVGALVPIFKEIEAAQRFLPGGTFTYFVGSGALHGGAMEGPEGAFWGAVHGATLDLAFKGASLIKSAPVRTLTTGTLFALPAWLNDAPPDDVAALLFLGWGLGAQGITQNRYATKKTSVMIAREAERQAQEIESKQRILAEMEPVGLEEVDWAWSVEPWHHLEQITSVNRVAERAVRERMGIREANLAFFEESAERAGIPPAERETVRNLMDGQARAWAENHGRRVEEWYLMNSWHYGIEGGARHGDLILTKLESTKKGAVARKPKRNERQLQPPPPGETESPFKSWRPTDAAREYVRIKLNRQPGEGAPKTNRDGLQEIATRLGLKRLPNGVRYAGKDAVEFVYQDGPNAGKSIFFGNVKPENWVRMADQYVTDDAEFMRATHWYQDAVDPYQLMFGPDAESVLMMHFATQQNTSMVGGYPHMLNTISKLLGGGPPLKKSGLSENRLRAMVKGGVADMGPKLHDFMDSWLGKKTRTYAGDDPEAGAPFAVDVWAARNRGLVDPAIISSKDSIVRRMLTPAQLQVLEQLPVDVKGSLTDPQYENASEWGQRLTRHLNAIEYRGIKNWEPRMAQSLGWVVQQKASGVIPEYPVDAIVRNTFRVSFEVDSEFAPYMRSYGELNPEQRELVTQHYIAWALPKIYKEFGLPLRTEARVGSGGYGSYIEPAGWINIHGEQRLALAVADSLGYALGQKEMYVSRLNPKGDTVGIWVSEAGAGNRLADNATTVKFIQRIFDLDPRIQVGFDQVNNQEGRPGFRIMIPNKGYTPEETKHARWLKKAIPAEYDADMARAEQGKPFEGAMMRAIQQASAELGIDVDVRMYQADLFIRKRPPDQKEGLRYRRRQDGGGYLQGLDQSGVEGAGKWVEGDFSRASHQFIEDHSELARRGQLGGSRLEATLASDETKTSLADMVIQRELGPRQPPEARVLEQRERGVRGRKIGPRAPRVLGQVEIPESGLSQTTPALIRLFEGANVSTAVHELGHILRQTLTPREVSMVEGRYGVKPGARWSREAEERFADNTERFLALGEVEDPKLGPVYAKLANMMRSVYEKNMPKWLQEGRLDAGMKAQYERWFSPSRARTMRSNTTGREYVLSMTYNALEFQGDPRSLINADRIYELTRSNDSSVQLVEGYADNINLAKIQDAPDIQRLLGELAFAIRGEPRPRIESRSLEETAKLADESGMTVSTLLSGRRGRLLDDADLTAARSVLLATGRELINSARKVQHTRAPEDYAHFYRMQFMHKAVRDEVSGQISKIARALGSLRLMLSVPEGNTRMQMLDMVIEQGGGPDALLEAAARIGTLEPGRGLSNQVDAEMRGGLRRAVMELWIMGLLSGFRTHMRNLLSNTGMAMMAPPEAFAAANIGLARTTAGRGLKVLMGDRAPQFFTNEDRVVYGEFLARGYGFLQGGRLGLKLAAKIAAGDEILDPLYRSSRPGLRGVQRLMERVREQEVGEISAIAERQTKLAEMRRGDFSVEGILGGRRAREWEETRPRVKHAIDEIGAIVRSPGLGLNAGDAIFKAIGYSQEIYARAWRQAARELPREARFYTPKFRMRVAELSSDPTPEMLEAAEYNAGYLTFTDALGPIANKIMQIRHKTAFARLLIPFMVAPTNIVKRAIERTPAAFASRKIRGEIKKGGAEADTLLARAMLGSMMLAGFAHLSAMGYTTGDGPTDPGLRASWLATHDPRSLFFGDPDTGVGSYYSYDWLEPFSSVIATGANIGETQVGKQYLAETVNPIASLVGWSGNYAEIAGQLEPETAQDLVEKAIQAVMKSFINKTYWRSLSELANVLTDQDRYFGKWAQAYARSVVPRAIGVATQVMDPTWREAYTLLDSVRSQFPGYKGPPHRNIFGKPIVFDGALGPDLVSPIYTKHVTGDKLWMEINRLHIPMNRPRRQIQGVELTLEEYDFLVASAGDAAYVLLTDVVNDRMGINPRSPEVGGGKFVRNETLMWHEMTNYEQKQVIKGILSKAYQDTREMMYRKIFAENPDRVLDPLQRQLGLPPLSEEQVTVTEGAFQP